MKLSELLKLAIEKHLASTSEIGFKEGKYEFSCYAIERCNEYSDSYFKIRDFLCALGLNTTGSGFNYLRDEDGGKGSREEPKYDLQFTRALWLTFVIEYLKDNPEEDFEV